MFATLFSALAPFIWHIGIASFLVILCGVGIWLLSSWKNKLICLGLALLIIDGVFWYITGAHNMKELCDAQQAILQTKVDAVVKQAQKPVAPKPSLLHPSAGLRYDKWDRNWDK